MKIETLNSANPYYFGKLSTDESFNISSKVQIISPYFSFSNNIPIEITKIYSTCGLGRTTGKVYVKICNPNLSLTYYDYSKTEYFSDGLISVGNPYWNYYSYFNIPNNKSLRISAKKSVLLLPGFSAAKGAVFKAEIKGCQTNN